jgi:large subunit ribosomal protein L24
MPKYKIKRGDRVVIISGEDKDSRGEVLIVDRNKGRVTVESVNMRKKHLKPNQENPQGSIVEREFPINISKVMLEETFDSKKGGK